MVTVPRYGYIIKEGGVPVLKAHSGRNVSLTFYKKKNHSTVRLLFKFCTCRGKKTSKNKIPTDN